LNSGREPGGANVILKAITVVLKKEGRGPLIVDLEEGKKEKEEN